MNLASWIIGPQMVGGILLTLGLIYYLFPPRHINRWYGYRMPSAQKNQKTWKEANRHSAICMLKSGLVLLIVGLLVTLMLKEISMPARLKEGLTAFFLIASGPAPALFIIVSTEKHLEKIFDQKSQ